MQSSLWPLLHPQSAQTRHRIPVRPGQLTSPDTNMRFSYQHRDLLIQSAGHQSYQAWILPALLWPTCVYNAFFTSPFFTFLSFRSFLSFHLFLSFLSFSLRILLYLTPSLSIPL